MGRQPRPHLQGATFHLASRLQQREPLFTPVLRSKVVDVLREQVACSDVQLFAYVVMPNHLHLVVRQGRASLGRFMQALLRRVALAVHRRFDREGHVFERRYRDRICADPAHLRNAIVYTNLNPVRAGLCADPGDYPWSSYATWAGTRPPPDLLPVAIDRAAPLFATAPIRTRDQLRADYRAFERWRQERDRLRAARDDDDGTPLPPPPSTTDGDAHWAQCLAPGSDPAKGSGASWESGRATADRPDLSAIATAVLRESEPGLQAALVRSRWGGPPYVRARHEVIRRADAVGYRGVQIAAYLRISTTAVSDVLTAARKRFIITRRP